MTDSFIKAVEAEPGTTYGRLLSAMRARIRDGQGSRRLPGRLGSFVRCMIPSSNLQVSSVISIGSALLVVGHFCHGLIVGLMLLYVSLTLD
jgi:hypothetical protein